MAGSDTTRRITTVARELQSAANRLKLQNQLANRDAILAALFPDGRKGRDAAARLEAQAPLLASLQGEVRELRAELSAGLDRVLEGADIPEPPKRKRSR